MTPYYERDGIMLFCGKAEDVLPALPAGSIDLVFTSPPYNLGGEPWPHLGHWKPGDGGSGSKSKWRNGSDACGGVQYGDHSDDLAHDDYVRWQRTVLAECWRLLTDRGAIYYQHKPRVIGGRLWLPLELNPELPVRQIVVWDVPTHEWIVVFAKPDFRLKSKGASGVGDVWYVPQDTENPHPAAFPLALPARAIETAGPGIVLDPFCGSGTTLRAAKDAGIRAIGVEQSERYCEMAVNRLRQGVLFPPETEVA